LRTSWKNNLFLRPRRPWLRGFLIWNICTAKPSISGWRVSEVAQRMAVLKPAPFVFTVAGTNGKGTTCRTLESVLMAAGYKVGVYSSPHLVRYTERVRVQGEELPELAHTPLLPKLKPRAVRFP
jgi:folylpolyglutamate synthase/dihydropteroate synthase